eukprot:5940005-Amphidinium_carterae.1
MMRAGEAAAGQKGVAKKTRKRKRSNESPSQEGAEKLDVEGDSRLEPSQTSVRHHRLHHSSGPSVWKAASR